MFKSVCFLLLGMALLSCTDQKEIQITGTVRNLNGGIIVYQHSIAAMMNTKTVDTLQIQSDSTFTLTLPAVNYERLNFVWNGKAVLGSVISKGGKIQLDVDATAQEPLTIQGVDEKVVAVSRLLNQLNEDVWNLRTRRGDRWQIAKDTVATSVAKKLKDDAAFLESQLAGLDKDLQEKARQDIRMQLLLAFQNQTMGRFYQASEATKQNWFTELDQLTAFCIPANPNSTFSPAFYDVVSNEIGIRYFMRQEPIPEGVEKGIGLMYHGFEYHLHGKAQEAAMALLFLEDQERQMNDPKMPAYAERFLQLYPASSWQPLVQEAMEKNRAFNQIRIPKDIHFPDVSQAKTLQHIIAPYKGKVIFMDIWATWCGPCRDSFAFVKPLQKYAQEKDIVLLYLSIDNPEAEEKWKKMAVHYNLKGEHIRVQEAFKQEIYDTFGSNGALYIPHGVIIGKDGKIRQKVAASPEKMEELKEQLEEAAE